MADFQRARRPEQVAQRRAAIVQAARSMLRDQPLGDISLRELSTRVGLAKSNVLRYFESREAIFLAVLDEEWGAWADRLPPLEGGTEGSATGDVVAATLAATLADAPLLCELWGALGSVLERNVDADTARTFKVTSTAHADRVVAWVVAALPAVDPTAARRLAAVTSVLAGALSAYERPSPQVAAVNREYGGFPAGSLEVNLRDVLIVFVRGLTR